MRIPVRYVYTGNLTNQITVQRYEDGELSWCNHAGAEVETFENEIPNPHGYDITWESVALVCKCGAQMPYGVEDWL